MSEKIHLIVAKENGSVKTLILSKKTISFLISSILIIFLAIGSLVTYSVVNYLHRSSDIEKKYNLLTYQLKEALGENCELNQRLKGLLAEKSRIIQTSLSAVDECKLLSKELNETTTENIKLREQLAKLEAEKEHILQTSIKDLLRRVHLMDDILSGLGIVPKNDLIKESGVGGPYIPIEQESLDELLRLSEKYSNLLQNVPLNWPVRGKVTSPYGRRRDPFTGRRAFHEGMDIKNKRGTKIKATAAGVVKRVSYDRGGYGWYLVIDHKNGFETIYGHFKKILVKKGEKVKRGDVIGLMGSTGRSTGSHVHYEIRLNGKPINPKKYLSVADHIKESSKYVEAILVE